MSAPLRPCGRVCRCCCRSNGSREPRRRSGGTAASWAASSPRSASRSASGTRADCRRRGSAPRRESPAARRHSGTQCSRFAFIRMAETVHTRSVVLISVHVASLTSADRAAVRTRNSNASLTAGCPDPDARTVSMAAATSVWGSASRCCTISFCGPSTGRTRSHGLSCLRSIAIAHSSTDRVRWRTARAVSALTCQMGVEDFQHVGRGDLGDRPAADARERIVFKAPPPALRGPPAAPAAALLFEHALGGVGEGGNALDATLVGQGVAAGPRQLAVGEGLLAGVGERHERDGAESAASSADDEPLDPASGTGRLHEQVQPVAVRVPSSRGGTDDGGREGLVGMPASALYSGVPRRFRSPRPSPHYMREWAGCHATSWPLQSAAISYNVLLINNLTNSMP